MLSAACCVLLRHRAVVNQEQASLRAAESATDGSSRRKGPHICDQNVGGMGSQIASEGYWHVPDFAGLKISTLKLRSCFLQELPSRIHEDELDLVPGCAKCMGQV